MVNVAILGFGTVGSGVAEVLTTNGGLIDQRVENLVRLKYILDVRDFPDSPYRDCFVKDFGVIESDPEVDIVVETIGGATVALDFTTRALKAGKSVVSSNKELVATHGYELLQLAREHGVSYLFEASVGGGIPILRPLTSCLAANELSQVTGILNGTTNYILTRMIKAGLTFEQALKEAQENGYAERDPSADVDGHDACRKICILAALAFGQHVYPDQVPTQGIRGVTLADVAYADSCGYKIKLLATAKKTDRTVECHVQPALVPFDHPLASVSNEFNAVFIKGNAVDDLMFYGNGAGPLPTGSAVMGDVIEIARAIDKGCAFDSTPILKTCEDVAYGGEGKNKYYLKLIVDDVPGMLGKISSTFGKYGISIASMMQRPNLKAPENTVPLVFILHEAERNVLDTALEELHAQSYVSTVGSVIRVEE